MFLRLVDGLDDVPAAVYVFDFDVLDSKELLAEGVTGLSFDEVGGADGKIGEVGIVELPRPVCGDDFPNNGFQSRINPARFDRDRVGGCGRVAKRIDLVANA